ncbi:MAG TPA: tetratricopeptide repeat protein [Anaerolineae bacterium]|nr:tetratricopeptide repeat protein [Anaerolineae bacterium]
MTTLPDHLAQLEFSGLVRLAQALPELEYLFRHALIQDAAYRSLVKADRRTLHRIVGEALERAYADRIDEIAPLLARHFDEAGDDDRALKYFTLAGDVAARTYANAEAILHYTCALQIAKRFPARSPTRLGETSSTEVSLTHLYTSLGQALELSARHAEALANYADMERLASERGDRAMELAALMARAKIHATLNSEQNPDKAQVLLEQALALARELRDRATECRVLWNLMLVFLWSGYDQHRAVAYGEDALALARELHLREQVAFTLNDLTYAYMSTGQWPRARAALDESRGIWRELGNQPMLADNVANSVLIHLRAGDFDQAVTAADEALRISRAIDNVWGQAGSQAYVGLVHWERGDIDRAVAVMEDSIRLGEQVGHPAPVVATRSDLAWVLGALGAVERGLALARLALDRAANAFDMHVVPLATIARLHLLGGDLASAEATLREAQRQLKPEGLQWFAPILVPLVEAELALARCDYADAAKVADKVLAYLRGSQTRLYASDTLYVKSRALLAQSRSEEASVVLAEALAEAEALGSRRMLWPILSALGDIESARGHDTVARALLQRAREVVGYIADHCPTDPSRGSGQSLRQMFFNQSEVRKVTSFLSNQ